MMRSFPLFSDLIRNVELAMSKADLTIARLYAELVPDAALRERVWSMLVEEFERTRRMLLSVTDQSGTAEGQSGAGPLDPFAEPLRGPDEPGAGRTPASQTGGWKSRMAWTMLWAPRSTESRPACTIRDERLSSCSVSS